MYKQNTLEILRRDVSQSPLTFHRPEERVAFMHPTPLALLSDPERMFEATNTLENSHLKILTEITSRRRSLNHSQSE